MYSIGYNIDEIEKVLDFINVENFLETDTDFTNLSLEKKESLKKYSFYINFDEKLNFSLPKGLKDSNEAYLICLLYTSITLVAPTQLQLLT